MAGRRDGPTVAGIADHDPHPSGWAPLRFAGYRRFWLAQFTSNVGSWMQTVAAQWLMTSLTSSAVLLGAIPAASSLPILLLAVPGGVLGDLVDRRRLIVAGQAVMLAAAAGLAVLAALDAITPATLLALLLVIGVGGAIGTPTWQTLQPELVPDEHRPEAIALGSVNQNLARAVGPAIGGTLLAATSAAVVFGVNAASFLAVLGAVLVTRLPARRPALPREHAIAAVRAGARFVAGSPALLALIVRAFAFILFASGIWTLLPLVARDRLGLGSAGYGLLLGCVGLGAVAAATFGPAAKRVLGPRAIYAAACLVVAAAAAVLATTNAVAVAVVALVGAGGAWILGIGLLGAAYQGQMPPWVKARGIAYYLLAFQGANAVGALAIGAVAQATSVPAAFGVLAAGLAATAALTWRVALPAATVAIMAAEPLPLSPDPPGDVAHAPVLVTVTYAVQPGRAPDFAAHADALRGARRRTGGHRWRLYEIAEDPGTFVETFLVGSWEEHERQHARLEQRDADLLAELDDLLVAGTRRSALHAVAVSHR